MWLVEWSQVARFPAKFIDQNSNPFVYAQTGGLSIKMIE